MALSLQGQLVTDPVTWVTGAETEMPFEMAPQQPLFTQFRTGLTGRTVSKEEEPSSFISPAPRAVLYFQKGYAGSSVLGY